MLDRTPNMTNISNALDLLQMKDLNIDCQCLADGI